MKKLLAFAAAVLFTVPCTFCHAEENSNSEKIKNLKNASGVVINAEGMGLVRCMSPYIYDEDGNIVYGRDEIRGDFDYVSKTGMVAYVKGVNSIKSFPKRTGDSPAVFKAVNVRNSPVFALNGCVVVSNEDAAIIREIDRNTKALYNRMVSFVE